MVTQLVNSDSVKQTEETKVETRTCANCACHSIQTAADGATHSFCRLDPPMAQRMRMERPRMRDGKAVIGRDNKPIMEQYEDMAFMYKPTLSVLVCFSGWRPIGVEPGDNTALSDPTNAVFESMRKLYRDMVSQGSVSFPEPEDFKHNPEGFHLGDDSEIHDGSAVNCPRCGLAQLRKQD